MNILPGTPTGAIPHILCVGSGQSFSRKLDIGLGQVCYGYSGNNTNNFSLLFFYDIGFSLTWFAPNSSVAIYCGSANKTILFPLSFDFNEFTCKLFGYDITLLKLVIRLSKLGLSLL